MKYINAADVLPEKLLIEVLKYVNGELLYIPIMRNKHKWGENSGSRIYYQERNQKIKSDYKDGMAMGQVAEKYSLSYDSVRKIIKA